MRRLIGLDLLILDDFVLQPLDSVETADFHELIVERHPRAATVITSNRDTAEWLAGLADPFRDELLNGWQFDSLLEARVLIEDWRIDYNTNRPHTAHGDLTPSEFARHPDQTIPTMTTQAA